MAILGYITIHKIFSTREFAWVCLANRLLSSCLGTVDLIHLFDLLLYFHLHRLLSESRQTVTTLCGSLTAVTLAPVHPADRSVTWPTKPALMSVHGPATLRSWSTWWTISNQRDLGKKWAFNYYIKYPTSINYLLHITFAWNQTI